MRSAPLELTPDEARRVALVAQGFIGAPDRRGGVPAVLRRVGAAQLDTIAVLARSQELVIHARLGAVPRERIHDAYWGDPPTAFEYWAHAACVLPIEDWPWYAMRRRRYRDATSGPAAARREILDRLAADGPQTARTLGGARLGGPWWDWSPLKRAAEELLASGEVVCVRREAWQRVYDLAERVIPEHLRAQEPSDEDCKRELARRAVTALGVATLGDIADYHRQRPGRLRPLIEDAGLVPVRVAGWNEPAWATAEALEAAQSARGRHRTTLLSPFDSLIWDRRRTERIFGHVHRLEAYVPAAKRVHGYFAMPVLAGGRIVGLVDPVRRGTTLVARQVSVASPRSVGSVAAAIREAAAWVGCVTATCERVAPSECAEPLREALSEAR